MKRRNFILGALSAPAVITTPRLLMPVRSLSRYAVNGIEPAMVLDFQNDYFSPVQKIAFYRWRPSYKELADLTK